MQGRDQLATLARGGNKGPLHVNHYIMNHIIEPTADGAVGRQYLINISHDQNIPQVGPNPNQWALVGQKRGSLDTVGGHYEDVYTKTPEGWRFRYRKLVPSKSGPDPTRTGTLKMHPVKPDPTDTVPSVPGGLSAMDYIEIERLVASYGHALDNGYGTTDNGEPYAGLYTADATFGQSTGHAQLAALGREQPQGPQYVRHYLTNSRDRAICRPGHREAVSGRRRHAGTGGKGERHARHDIPRRALRGCLSEDAGRMAHQDATALSRASESRCQAVNRERPRAFTVRPSRFTA